METPQLPAKLLLSIFVLLLMGLSLGNETAVHPIGFPTATNREIACEGLVINLRCPSHRVIYIEGANYGRTDNLTCARNPRRMRNTNCRHPDSLKTMADRCNNRSQCVVPALDGVFGEDPCPDTYKYLEVFFRCVSSCEYPSHHASGLPIMHWVPALLSSLLACTIYSLHFLTCYHRMGQNV
ncbi:latrotoxin receptor [Branchiostoma belcheri]|nr:latrotoxin receptor [Branchiostoma belcheri]